MFKFATLVSVVAADATQTADKLINKLKKNGINGTSDIKLSGLSMPQTTDLAYPSFTDIQKPTTDDNSKPCAWAGGAWTKKSSTESQCDFSSKAGEAVIKGLTKKELAEPVTLDQKLSFETFFKTFDEGTLLALTEVSSPVDQLECTSTFDADTWSAMSPALVEKENALAKKDGSKTTVSPASWKYSWVPSNEDINKWCFMKTQLPKTWAGGLIIQHTTNEFVNVAVRTDATAPRYFSQHTLKTNSVGKTGKVPIASARSVEVFMQSTGTKPTTAMTADTTTSVTFTRISMVDITKLIVENGGAIVWIIIGILVCLGCLAGFLLYKMGKCCVREIEGDKENEFYQEDCYVRV